MNRQNSSMRHVVFYGPEPELALLIRFRAQVQSILGWPAMYRALHERSEYAVYQMLYTACDALVHGGEGGIRTLETLADLHAFQACALGHYATSPWDCSVTVFVAPSTPY